MTWVTKVIWSTRKTLFLIQLQSCNVHTYIYTHKYVYAYTLGLLCIAILVLNIKGAPIQDLADILITNIRTRYRLIPIIDSVITAHTDLCYPLNDITHSLLRYTVSLLQYYRPCLRHSRTFSTKIIAVPYSHYNIPG